MHAEFRSVMHDLELRDEIRVVVVTGTPPAFCVGGDSDALAQHAERGGYDSGLPPEPATPGINRRPEYDDDFAWMFGFALRSSPPSTAPPPASGWRWHCSVICGSVRRMPS